MSFWGGVKDVLRRLPAAERVNAATKNALLAHRTRVLSRAYADAPSVPPQRELPALVAARRPAAGADKRGAPLRIVWIGTHRDQDYSGFVQALERRGRLTLFAAFPGGYGQAFPGPALTPDEARGANGAAFEALWAKAGPFDVVIGQMLGDYFPLEPLRAARRRGAVVINIAMDDRLPELWPLYGGPSAGAVGLSDGTDLVLTTAPECAPRYFAHGCPALYWPLGSDPDIFKPEREKVHDVVFVGTRYGIRGRMVEALRRAGLRVDAFGPGWAGGSLDWRSMAQVFSRSKIILGFGAIAHSDRIFTLKLRDFDATMAGAAYLTHRNPDLLAIFEEGREIHCFADAREAVRKAQELLRNPRLLVETGRAGRAKALRYAWDARLVEAFAAAGLGAARA